MSIAQKAADLCQEGKDAGCVVIALICHPDGQWQIAAPQYPARMMRVLLDDAAKAYEAAMKPRAVQ